MCAGRRFVVGLACSGRAVGGTLTGRAGACAPFAGAQGARSALGAAGLATAGLATAGLATAGPSAAGLVTGGGSFEGAASWLGTTGVMDAAARGASNATVLLPTFTVVVPGGGTLAGFAAGGALAAPRVGSRR